MKEDVVYKEMIAIQARIISGLRIQADTHASHLRLSDEKSTQEARELFKEMHELKFLDKSESDRYELLKKIIGN